MCGVSYSVCVSNVSLFHVDGFLASLLSRALLYESQEGTDSGIQSL